MRSPFSARGLAPCLLALLLAASPVLAAQAAPSPVSVRGPDWALLLDLPPGWVQDRRSLYRSGIEALFLGAGVAYADAPVLVTILPLRRVPGEAAPLTRMAARSPRRYA